MLLLVLGGIGFFGTAYISLLQPPWVHPSTELPLGDVNGIAIGKSGRIFCGLPSYSRIQLYDSSGRFVRGWFLGTSGGEFRLRMNSLNHLEVATLRDRTLYAFDEEGRLVRRQTGADRAYEDFGEAAQRSSSSNGDTYSIEGAPLYPHIVKTGRTGRKETVIRTPWGLFLVMGPLPAWLFWALGIVLLILSARRGRRNPAPEK